jgi:hypothetical protein
MHQCQLTGYQSGWDWCVPNRNLNKCFYEQRCAADLGVCEDLSIFFFYRNQMLNNLLDVSGMIGGSDSLIFEFTIAIIIQFRDVFIYIHIQNSNVREKNLPLSFLSSIGHDEFPFDQIVIEDR